MYSLLLRDPEYRDFIIDKQKFWGRNHLSHISDNLKNLLDSMLSYDPMLRPNVADIN